MARIRPYDRGEHNPCELHVFGQHAAGLPITRFATWNQANVSWERLAQLRGLMLKAPEMNQLAHPDLLAQKGRSSEGADEQRFAWLIALIAHLAAFFDGRTGGRELWANPYKKVKEEGVEFIGNDWPTIGEGIKTDCPTSPPPTDTFGNALAEFTLMPTPENPRPYRQIALVSVAMAKAAVLKHLGRPVAEGSFRWLSPAEGVQLLLDAVAKDARRRIAAADKARAAGDDVGKAAAYFEKQARALGAGQMHWSEYARCVMGLAVPLVAAPSVEAATEHALPPAAPPTVIMGTIITADLDRFGIVIRSNSPGMLDLDPAWAEDPDGEDDNSYQVSPKPGTSDLVVAAT